MCDKYEIFWSEVDAHGLPEKKNARVKKTALYGRTAALTICAKSERIVHTLDVLVKSLVCGTHQRISVLRKKVRTEVRYEFGYRLPGYQYEHEFSKDML
jgi:hypothetical protein